MNVDNEAANDFWEYKLPQGVRKPKESSSADEAWRFIQRKYERREFVPNNAVDPVTEFKEPSTKKKILKKKPATPPTDDDIVIEKTKKKVKKQVEKVDIKDILDIDISGQEKQKPVVKNEITPKTEMLWDLFDSSAPIQPKVNQPQQVKAANSQPVNFFGNQQTNRFAAFDQMTYPIQCNSWNACRPAPCYPINTSFGAPVVKQKVNVDNKFADILPSDFI